MSLMQSLIYIYKVFRRKIFFPKIKYEAAATSRERLINPISLTATDVCFFQGCYDLCLGESCSLHKKLLVVILPESSTYRVSTRVDSYVRRQAPRIRYSGEFRVDRTTTRGLTFVMQTVKIEEVNIETINTCTRKCTYCKFGIERKWDKKIMPTEIFEKILYDLKEIHYSGFIGPFVNNEPLMDKRMTSFVKMISNVLPAAKSYLFSNGDLLDQTILRGLLDAGLHRLFVSVHSRECFERLSELASRFGREKVTPLNFFDADKTKSFHNRQCE